MDAIARRGRRSELRRSGRLVGDEGGGGLGMKVMRNGTLDELVLSFLT